MRLNKMISVVTSAILSLLAEPVFAGTMAELFTVVNGFKTLVMLIAAAVVWHMLRK